MKEISEVELEKIKDLVKRFCNYYEEKPQEDSYHGFHGFMTALLHEAIEFGRKMGRQETAYEQAVNKFVIQPENDRVWEKELAELRAKCNESNLEGRILLTIAEMILYRRRGG